MVNGQWSTQEGILACERSKTVKLPTYNERI